MKSNFEGFRVEYIRYKTLVDTQIIKTNNTENHTSWRFYLFQVFLPIENVSLGYNSQSAVDNRLQLPFLTTTENYCSSLFNKTTHLDASWISVRPKWTITAGLLKLQTERTKLGCTCSPPCSYEK